MTVEEALAHPTWSMGPKITIDSATLANKGLELIEAHYLFGLDYERIEVVVHPTSVVHALVRFRDGAALAHLGYPDMRVPISYALTYPDRRATPVSRSTSPPVLTLEFEQPDSERFPLLALAREAGERGGTYPCAFNAANEVAVAAFLDGRIGFPEIAGSSRMRSDVDGAPAGDLAELVEVDGEARRVAQEDWPTHEHLHRDPGPGAPHPRPRGRALLRVARRRSAAAALLHRLPAGDPAKTTRKGIEYGVGSIPLGGFVTIPGMHARSRTMPSGGRARSRRLPSLAGPVTESSAHSTETTSRPACTRSTTSTTPSARRSCLP